MLDVGAENLHITARRYMSITKISKATATRDLVELQKLDCIKKLETAGRSTSYIINLPKTQ